MKILIKEIEYNEFLYLEEIDDRLILKYDKIDNAKDLHKIILDFNPIFKNPFYKIYLKYKNKNNEGYNS